MANLENIRVKAVITATSNKQKKGFDSDPRKTVYFNVVDEQDRQLLKEFGITEYTPNDKKEPPFYIVKASEEIKLYQLGRKEYVTTLDTSSTSNNFSTGDSVVGLSILKGKSEMGNEYKRLYAILVKNLEDIKVVEPENPFEDMEL